MKIFVGAGIPAELITTAAGDPAAKRGAGDPPVDVTITRAKGRKRKVAK
ncbi:MAG: hypothetical protein U1A78_37205 [Polyangia bacterium]